MTTQFNDNKRTILTISLVGIIIFLFIISLPFWKDNCEWSICISISGTLLSLTAVIIGVIEIYGMKKSNEAVTIAVNNTEKTILKISNLYDISRHAQMINEIQAFLNGGKWELAHLRMVELHIILNDIKSNYKEFEISEAEVLQHILNIRNDLRSLNNAINSSDRIKEEVILNHLDDVAPFLGVICSKIKKNKDNERKA